MKNKNINFKIVSFYRFKEIKNKKTLKILFDNFLRDKFVRGTILLADEGINGSLASSIENINICLQFIKKQLKIKKLHLQENEVQFIPFNRMKVRLKKEIVSLGKGEIKINDFSNTHLSPKEWDNFVRRKEVKIIDTRNRYEVQIGKFKKAINPFISSFREFPKQLNNLDIKKTDKIAIYCTGGIRCEKATEYMKLKGYKNVFQLDGGILNYMDFKMKNKSKSIWQGECFVFDNRVTVSNDLKPGRYMQCYGCRMPISVKDTKSSKYIKGVSCPYCYENRSNKQKNNSKIRQRQIEDNEKKGFYHTFKRIKALDMP